MTPEEAAAWFAAVVSAIGLVWTIINQSLERSSKTQGERAEQAARLFDLMQNLDLGGTKQTLDEQARRSLHAEQLAELQRVIRLGTTGFLKKSLKPNVLVSTIVLIAVYASLFLLLGISILPGGGDTDGERSTNAVAGIVLISLAIVGFIATGRLLWRRQTNIALLRKSGVEIKTGIRDDWQEIRTAMKARRNRRRQKRDLGRL